MPFVVVHQSSRVRIGDTVSRLASRSSGFFFELRNDRRSRRLIRMVNLVMLVTWFMSHRLAGGMESPSEVKTGDMAP